MERKRSRTPDSFLTDPRNDVSYGVPIQDRVFNPVKTRGLNGAHISLSPTWEQIEKVQERINSHRGHVHGIIDDKFVDLK